MNARFRQEPIKNLVPVAKGSEPIWELKTDVLSRVKATPVKWVVRAPDGGGLLPAGLVVFVGDPGAGKSTVTRAVISAVTTGKGEFQTDLGEAMFLYWEDDEASDILPHVLACGGDPRKIHMVRGIASDIGAEKAFTPSHIGLVWECLEKHRGIRLVVIDVLASMTSAGRRDSHNGEDIRSILDPLHKLGQELGVSILLLHHLNKRTGEGALTRIGGSVQIAGTARMVWLIAADPDQPEIRRLAEVKGNLVGRSKGFAFKETPVDRTRVEAWAADCGVELPQEIDPATFRRVQILEGLEPIHANDLARGAPKQGQESALIKAEAWLRAHLGEHGEVADQALKVAAKRDAIGKNALWAAKRSMKDQGHIRMAKRGSEWWLIATSPEGQNFEDVFPPGD